MSSDAKTYDKPQLRERIKAKVMAGDKGGRPGQWSARKAQLVAHEYAAAGGSYKSGKSDGQTHLDQWTAEKWQTEDGKPAKTGKATTHRYLPKAAWDKLSPAERRKTDAKKVAGGRRGKQFVANTPAAKKARRAATATTKLRAMARKRRPAAARA
jgi:hypothetical protein